MSRRLACLAVAALLLTAVPAWAASPKPSPQPLPIKGVTVEVQPSMTPGQPANNGASHIERPPFMAPPAPVPAATTPPPTNGKAPAKASPAPAPVQP